jgi:type VI secretion system protein ImpK
MSNPSFNAGNNRTFVMPSPGGAAAPLSAAGQPAWQSHEPEIPSGNSPLIALANPILNLVYQIRTLVHNADPEKLRNYLADEIRRFDATAKAQGIPAEHIVAARYCLCTVLDEAAAQTPWGGSGAWSRNSLLVTFHNETWGGEKFFQLLAKLAQTPAQYIDVLELMYYCIALGFEGRYRIVSNGQSQLENLKRRLADIIKTARGVPDRALSIHWQGHAAELPRIWGMIPVWVTGILAVLLGVGFYMLLAFWLAARSDKTFITCAAAGRARRAAAAALLEIPREGNPRRPRVRQGKFGAEHGHDPRRRPVRIRQRHDAAAVPRHRRPHRGCDRRRQRPRARRRPHRRQTDTQRALPVELGALAGTRARDRDADRCDRACAGPHHHGRPRRGRSDRRQRDTGGPRPEPSRRDHGVRLAGGAEQGDSLVLRRLFSLIFNRYIFITLGLIALALAIWFLGPCSRSRTTGRWNRRSCASGSSSASSRWCCCAS